MPRKKFHYTVWAAYIGFDEVAKLVDDVSMVIVRQFNLC